MRVVVVGTGHVGLITAVTLAAIGHDVAGVDDDEEKIGALGQGICPFFEPGLETLLEQMMSAGRLRFDVDPTNVIRGAEVIFFCVGTPARVSGEANLVALEGATRISSSLSGPAVVVEKSPSRRYCGESLFGPEVGASLSVDEIEVVSNPEFPEGGRCRGQLASRPVSGGEARSVCMARDDATSVRASAREVAGSSRRTWRTAELAKQQRQRLPRAQDLFRQRARTHM